MAYFDNTNNTDFYSTSSASEEFDVYQFLSQMSAIEAAIDLGCDTFTDHWNMGEQLGPTVGSQASLQATTNYEPLASVTSYVTQTDGNSQPSYFGNYWPTVGHQSHPQNPYLDDTFARTITSEVSTIVPTPRSDPLDYWGANQSGPSRSTFYANVRSSYQPGTGPIRAGSIPTEWFQPYGASHARFYEHGNAEAGPSTLAPPPVPYVGPPIPQPSGGIPETTADAGNQKIAEEHKAPTTKRTKRPYGKGPPRQHRTQMQGDVGKLRAWVQRQKGLPKAPTVNSALTVAAEIIPIIRPLESLEPRLLTAQGRRTTVGSRKADREFEKRKVERRLLQELSKYFPPEQGQNMLSRSSLLSQVLKDLEELPALPGPSNEPNP